MGDRGRVVQWFQLLVGELLCLVHAGYECRVRIGLLLLWGE